MKEKIEITLVKGIDDHGIMEEEKCEYCKERGLKKALVVDDLVTLSIKKKKILGFCLEIDLEDLTGHLISTNINYCPMCGRKLGK